jgi:hypothetical protein
MSPGEADRHLLQGIVDALEGVGRELDAADHLPGHDPWPAIESHEQAVRQLAGQLSEGFRDQHAALARGLQAKAALHLSWGGLRDQLKRILSPSSSPSPDISS